MLLAALKTLISAISLFRFSAPLFLSRMLQASCSVLLLCGRAYHYVGLTRVRIAVGDSNRYSDSQWICKLRSYPTRRTPHLRSRHPPLSGSTSSAAAGPSRTRKECCVWMYYLRVLCTLARRKARSSYGYMHKTALRVDSLHSSMEQRIYSVIPLDFCTVTSPGRVLFLCGFGSSFAMQ